MSYSRLSDRLAFDVKFLLWRAEVHLLPEHEVARRYREIERHYLSLAGQEERPRLQAELRVWHDRFCAARNPPSSPS